MYHEAVLIKLLTSAEAGPPVKRSIYQWSRVDTLQLHQLKNNLCSSYLVNYSPSTPIDILWEEVKVLCHKCLSTISTKQITSNAKKPWINSNIKTLSRRKPRLYKRARQSG